MPLSSQRALSSLALSAVLALSACSSAEPSTLACETEAECPAATRCISGGCVANAPPSAAIAVPAGELQANLLHAFDGSESADPDEGDAIASFEWAFRSLDADCEPPVVAGIGPVATVRFACPGRYAVDLAAMDQLGAKGRRTVEFTVAPYTGPALVVAGPDVSVNHACTASPQRCANESAIALAADAPGFAPGEVSWAWTVEPPANRPLDGSRRVAFQPDSAVASPTVVVETDGTSISGDWVFRVVARDAAGVLGSAALRVSVLNRAPVVTGTLPVPIHHAFLGDRFAASGEIAVTVSDPDGDPLVQRSAQWRRTGDGPGGVFEGLDQGTKLTFSVAVPYAAPSDALHLIGGPGLERLVELAISDVNGARTSTAWPIVVANRPPVVVSTPAPFTVDHTYDPGLLAYRATAALSTFSDPDGDPLFAVPGAQTGDPQCSLVVDAGSRAQAECSLAFIGTPAVANFAGAHVVTQHVQDPWTAAAPVTATFTIGNRPPSITSAAPHLAGAACTFTGPCCVGPPTECLEFWSSAPSGTSVVPSRWTDPDGDPLGIQVGASGAVTPVQPLVCTPSTCALQLQLGPVSVCGSVSTNHATTVTDGLASATGTLGVERRCSL